MFKNNLFIFIEKKPERKYTELLIVNFELGEREEIVYKELPVFVFYLYFYNNPMFYKQKKTIKENFKEKKRCALVRTMSFAPLWLQC